MSKSIEVTYVRGGKTYTRTTTSEKKGAAYVYNPDTDTWVKPPKPAGDGYEWSDNHGWVTKASTAASFGFTTRLIQSDHSLETLFNQAWAAEKNGTEWSKEKFITALKSTDWFKSANEAGRNFAVLKATDPKEYATQRDAREALIKDLATESGSNLVGQELRNVTLQTLQLGMSKEQIQDLLATKIEYVGKGENQRLIGGAGDKETILREWMDSNGVNFDNDWVKNTVAKITAGDMTIGNAKDQITNLAKKTYPAHADYITSEMSTKNAGIHYQNIISQMLGVPSGEITMKNPWMKKLMGGKEENGQELTIDSAEKMIRNSDEWANSKPGTEEINDFTNKLLSQFGMI